MYSYRVNCHFKVTTLLIMSSNAIELTLHPVLIICLILSVPTIQLVVSATRTFVNRIVESVFILAFIMTGSDASQNGFLKSSTGPVWTWYYLVNHLFGSLGPFWFLHLTTDGHYCWTKNGRMVCLFVAFNAEYSYVIFVSLLFHIYCYFIKWSIHLFVW